MSTERIRLLTAIARSSDPEIRKLAVTWANAPLEALRPIALRAVHTVTPAESAPVKKVSNVDATTERLRKLTKGIK
jgi:hypothetical protein